MKKASSEVRSVKFTSPLYYITNQYNLREILAGGFIGTLNSFDDKYYSDLLEFSPGRIPLFTGQISGDLITLVNAHDPVTSYAAVLEISSSFSTDGEMIAFPDNDNLPIQSYAFAGLISLKDVSAIHFLSHEKLDEFIVRPYRNMHHAKSLYKVSPGLIADVNHGQTIIEWLKSLPSIESPSKQKFIEADKIGGSITLAIYNSSGKDQSKQFLKLMESIKRQKKAEHIPYWFNKAFDLHKTEAGSDDINEIVFRSTIDILMGYDWTTINQKTKVLDEIKKAVYSNSLKADQVDILDRSFLKIERLLKLQDDLKPFSSTPGQDAIRGLLLFLMRPEPKDLLMWKPDETNASQDAMLTALAFSGLVIGRKGLDTTYKPNKVDQELADLTIERLMSTEAKSTIKKPINKSKTKKEIESDSTINSAEALKSLIPQDTSIETIDWKKMKSKIVMPGLNDPEVYQTAINFCQQMGWNDCVSTVVRSGGNVYKIESNEAGELTMQISGFSKPMYQLHSERFSQKLDAMESD